MITAHFASPLKKTQWRQPCVICVMSRHLLPSWLRLRAAAQAQETIKIGLVQPLTGSVAYNGTADVAGSKQAVDERNAKGGVLGKKIELVIEDGQCQPANSVNAAEKLIQRDKVVAISGAFCSSATAAVMPVAEQYKLPLITGVVVQVRPDREGQQVLLPRDRDRRAARQGLRQDPPRQAEAAERGLHRRQRRLGSWRRRGVLQRDEALGAKTGDEGVLRPRHDRLLHLLTKLKASKADGVFVAAETQDGSILVKQIKELGLDIKVFGVGSWATSDFISAGRPGRRRHLRRGAVCVDACPTPTNQAFVKNYSSASTRSSPASTARPATTR